MKESIPKAAPLKKHKGAPPAFPEGRVSPLKRLFVHFIKNEWEETKFPSHLSPLQTSYRRLPLTGASIPTFFVGAWHLPLAGLRMFFVVGATSTKKTSYAIRPVLAASPGFTWA
jgi:hypothetical protein